VRWGGGGGYLEADDSVDVGEELHGLGAVVHGGGPHHAHIAESVPDLCDEDAELVEEALALLVHPELADIANEVQGSGEERCAAAE
jgi:hypothetical protein